MRYKKLSLYTVTKGEYGNPDTDVLVKKFDGVIWHKTVVGFDNGKQKSSVVPTLMYDLGAITIDQSKPNIVKDTDGTRYIITESHQPNGISGITPLSFKTKVEITLEKAL